MHLFYRNIGSRKYINVIISIICLTASLYGQSNRTFYMGHSLVNFQIPQMVAELAKDAGSPMHYKACIVNGANLGWHWTQPQSAEGYRWDMTLNIETFDHFILTEAVPLKGQLKWSDTYGFVEKFYQFAINKSPDIQLYIYETWHCTDSGTTTKCDYDDDTHLDWRNRLDLDKTLWEGIADEHNKKHAKKAIIIPGGQGLARLHDAIYRGELSGFTSHKQLFSDNIHLSPIGNYFIACIMYAVLYKKSPEGLANQLKNIYGELYQPAPTPQQAKVLQRIAWETVCGYADRTQVNCTTAIQDWENERTMYFNYPFLTLENPQDEVQLQVFNLQGQLCFKANLHETISLEFLPTGIYIAKAEGMVPLKVWIP